MTAAMRVRSVSERMVLGVRFKMSMKSARSLGVYLEGLAGVLGVGERNFSNLGSSQRMNFCIKSLNMILYIISLVEEL